MLVFMPVYSIGFCHAKYAYSVFSNCNTVCIEPLSEALRTGKACRSSITCSHYYLPHLSDNTPIWLIKTTPIFVPPKYMEMRICTLTYSFCISFFTFKGIFFQKKWKFHHSVLHCFVQKHTCKYISHNFLHATLKLQFSSLTIHSILKGKWRPCH